MAKPVLVYLVTEDWYFLSHRLPMALAARDAGYEVHVATHLNGQGAAIERHGFALHPLDWRRGSLDPRDLARIVRQIRALYRTLAPDLVHHVGLQPAIIGSLSALGLPPVRLNALAGMGYGFTSRTLNALLLRPALSLLMRLLFSGEKATVLVQNPNDRDAMAEFGVSPDRVFLIPGSGVDTDMLQQMPEPQGEVTAAFVGRLLDDKGVRTLIAAHERLAGQGRGVKLLIAGDRDEANPASIPQDEMQCWAQIPDIEMLGHVADIRDVWRRAHIAVLPSRREGLPKSLLDAAACGRAMVATDVPGCREIARAGLNAILVPPDDAAALANAIAQLAADPQLRQDFGAAGRRLVETEFSSAQIGAQTVSLYNRLLGRAS
jgi:glycosyltransferase involved in cell wall biosynthesis